MGFGVCVFILRESVCVRGSAHKSNVVQEAGQCVCVCVHIQTRHRLRLECLLSFLSKPVVLSFCLILSFCC